MYIYHFTSKNNKLIFQDGPQTKIINLEDFQLKTRILYKKLSHTD